MSTLPRAPSRLDLSRGIAAIPAFSRSANPDGGDARFQRRPASGALPLSGRCASRANLVRVYMRATNRSRTGQLPNRPPGESKGDAKADPANSHPTPVDEQGPLRLGRRRSARPDGAPRHATGVNPHQQDVLDAPDLAERPGRLPNPPSPGGKGKGGGKTDPAT